jgi:hypothetical protein
MFLSIFFPRVEMANSHLASSKFTPDFHKVGADVWDAWDGHLEKIYQGIMNFSA